MWHNCRCESPFFVVLFSHVHSFLRVASDTFVPKRESISCTVPILTLIPVLPDLPHFFTASYPYKFPVFFLFLNLTKDTPPFADDQPSSAHGAYFSNHCGTPHKGAFSSPQLKESSFFSFFSPYLPVYHLEFTPFCLGLAAKLSFLFPPLLFLKSNITPFFLLLVNLELVLFDC